MNETPTEILLVKWADRIPKGWYGFSCIPEHWFKPIDSFLTKVEKLCPDFEIHQIKEKFGTARIYIETNSRDSMANEEVQNMIDALEESLFV